MIRFRLVWGFALALFLFMESVPKDVPSQGIGWAAPWGNDDSDCKTRDSACLTVAAATWKLPNGSSAKHLAGLGRVYVADYTQLHPTAGCGLWLRGPQDSQYGVNTASGCWTDKPQALYIIGVPTQAYSNVTGARWPAARVWGGSNSDGLHPVIWLSDLNISGGFSLQYVAPTLDVAGRHAKQCLLVGVDSMRQGPPPGAGRGSGASGIQLDAISCAADPRARDNPPPISFGLPGIGTETFWVDATRIGVSGNIAAPLNGPNTGIYVGHDPNGNLADVDFNDVALVQAGIYYDTAQGASFGQAQNVEYEGNASAQSNSPIILAGKGCSYWQCYFKFSEIKVNDARNTPSVWFALSGAIPRELIVVDRTHGYPGPGQCDVNGPATLMGQTAGCGPGASYAALGVFDMRFPSSSEPRGVR